MRLALAVLLISGCAPPLELSAESVDFGALGDCQVHTRELVLRNVGHEPLTVNVSRVDEFIVEPTDNVTLQAGEALPVRITFDAALGARSQQRVLKIRHETRVIEEVPVFVTMASNDFGQRLDFGEVAVGDTHELNGPFLHVSQRIEGVTDGFAVTRQPSGQTTVRFEPTETRNHSARMLVTNEGRCPNVIQLSGVVRPALVAAPVQLKFTGAGEVPLSLTNNSTRPLQVTDITVNDPEFTVSSAESLPPASRRSDGTLFTQSVRVNVKWTPTKSGTRRAELSMHIDRPTQPTVVVPISATAP